VLSEIRGKINHSPEPAEGNGKAPSPDTAGRDGEGAIRGSSFRALELAQRLELSSSDAERRAIIQEFGADGPVLLLTLLKMEVLSFGALQHSVSLLEAMKNPLYERDIEKGRMALLQLAFQRATQLIAVVDDVGLSSDRRVKAVEDLGRIDLPIARKAIEKFLLEAEDPRVRAAAAAVLGGMGNAAAVPALVAALRDREEEVRGEVISALGMIGPAARPAVPALTGIVRSGRHMFYTKAVEALIAIGCPPVDILTEHLKDSDSDLQDAAHRGLIAAGVAAFPALTALIRGGDPELRTRAAQALGRIKDPLAVPILIEALKDDEAFVRVPASNALAGIGAPAVPALVGALRHKDDLVALSAGKILGRIKDPLSVPGLIESLLDSRAEWFLYRETVSLALAEMREVALPALIEALKDRARPYRERIADALGNIDEREALIALIGVLGDEDPIIRERAAEALGRIGDAVALGALIVALDDESPPVRWQAALALGAIGPSAKMATPKLINVMKHENSGLQVPAAMALLKIMPKNQEALRSAARILADVDLPVAVATLIDALKSGDFDLRREAARALGKQRAVGAIPALSEALNDEHAEVRWMASWALGEIQDPAVIALLAATLKDEDGGVRWMAAESLSRRESEARPAFRELLLALKDPDSEVRNQVAFALGEIREPQAIVYLREALLVEPDETARLGIWRAIEKIKSAL
jgi:HEAT repeat protein